MSTERSRAAMASHQARLAKRNAAIIQDFANYDTSKYKLAYILEELAQKYYLAPATIERIVANSKSN